MASLTSVFSNKDSINSRISGSVRMFGMPHQLLKHNDPRLGVGTDLGTMFAETMILEAPIVAIKPGKSVFLPGEKESTEKKLLNEYLAITGNIEDEGLDVALSEAEADNIKWFGHKAAYNEYMIGVNMICRVMARYYGISNERVPWSGGTFGSYDWRGYSFSSQYNRTDAQNDKTSSGNLFTKLADMIETMTSSLDNPMEDTTYLQFYVDANATYNESADNTTAQSILTSFTDKIETAGKELMVIGAISGAEDFEKTVESVTESGGDMLNGVASAIDFTKSEGISKLMGRLVSGAKQVIRGGNFVLPERFDDSSYSRSYSFTVTLHTPYGNKLAHFLNVGVPLAHILGFTLPIQTTANTFKSPYLLKVFSQGWFNCSMGIASIGITKGSDWAANGLPNEVKVDITIKDLYSALFLPQTTANFISNSGLIEFLMVNCGVDITNQDLFSSWNIWNTLLQGNIKDKVTRAPYQVAYSITEAIRNKMTLFN